MSWILPTLEHGEGDALRRAVLVRNAMTVTFLAKVRAAHTARLAASRVLVGAFSSHTTSSSASKKNNTESDSSKTSEWPPSTNSWPSTKELEDSRQAAARSSPVQSTYKFKTKEDEERWTLMVNRGFHPADRIPDQRQDEEKSVGEEGEEILLQRSKSVPAEQSDEVKQFAKIEVYDYASDDSVCGSDSEEEDDDIAVVGTVHEEKVWFDGLLQEVSTDRQGIPASAAMDNDQGRSTIYSSTPSLPSLIVDDDDDDEESDAADDADDEGEDEERGEQEELTTAQKYLKPAVGLDPLSLFSPHAPSYLYCYSPTASATDDLP